MPVGTCSPQGDGPNGCMDVSGNVWEWTATWYGSGQMVVRGGSWGDFSYYVRGANRVGVAPGVSLALIGFRCARGSD